MRYDTSYNTSAAASFQTGQSGSLETDLTRPNVLLIEDEEDMYNLLIPALEAAGFRVVLAETGERGVELCRDWTPHMVLLDLRLPGIDGFEVCRRIRSFSQVPIIVLSVLPAREYMEDAIAAGANDYFVKDPPFRQLIQHLRTRLVRPGPIERAEDTPRRLARHGLTLVRESTSVMVNGREVQLAPKEYDVLRYLALHADRVITYHALLRDVWGPGYEDKVPSLRVFVDNMRRKIEPNPAQPRYLVSVAKVGYRLSVLG